MAKKILVCDSEHEDIKRVVTNLRSWGYQVLVAEDAPQSVHLAHHEKPDLILLDIMMSAGGKEVHKNLGFSIETELIPVLLFSALSEDRLRQLVKEYGAVDFVAKPYDPVILHAKIQKIFGDATQYRV